MADGALEATEALLHRLVLRFGLPGFPPTLDTVRVSMVFDNFQEQRWQVGA
jgi:hypothetical protein